MTRQRRSKAHGRTVVAEAELAAAARLLAASAVILDDLIDRMERVNRELSRPWF